MMHQALSPGSTTLPSSPRRELLREGWPWLVALIPWIILINYLRLEWSANEQYSYGFVVPLLSLYIVLQLWPTRPEPRPLGLPLWLGLLTVLLAALVLPLLLLVEASPEWRLVGWFLAVVTTGLSASLILQRAGWPWLRHFAFPLLFIGAAVPWPTALEYKVMVPLMQWDASTAVEILNWCGIPAVQHQNVIELPNGYVGVDEACSGIRSLQTSLMIALFVGEWLQLPWVRRVILLGAALALTYIFNLFRTLALVTLSANWGSASLHRWHDTIGLVVLALSLGGLWLLAVAIQERGAPTIPLPGSRMNVPAPWRKGVLATLGVWLLLAFLGTQAWFDWHEAHAASAIRWNVNWPVHLSTFEAVEIPVEARTSLRYDPKESSAAKWQRPNTPALWLGYFMRWEPGRETSILASTHHPDVCLPATGKPLIADDGTAFFPAAGLELPVQIYEFNDAGQPLFVFYCVWMDGPGATTTGENPNAVPAWVTSLRKVLLPYTPASAFDYRLSAIAQGRRNQGQQVFEMGLWGATSLAEAKKEFAPEFAQVVQRLP